MTMHAIAAYAQNVCFFMEAPSIGLTCDDDAPMRQTSQRKLTFPIKKPSVTCVFADHRGLCAVEWRKTYAVEPPQLDPDLRPLFTLFMLTDMVDKTYNYLL